MPSPSQAPIPQPGSGFDTGGIVRPTSSPVQRKRRSLLSAGLAFIAAAAVGLAFVDVSDKRREESLRRDAREAALTRARSIEAEVEKTVASLYPLAAIAGDSGRADTVASLANALLKSPSNVTSIAVAEGGVVTSVQPEGMFASPGVDLKQDARVGPSVIATLETQSTNVSKPFPDGRRGMSLALCVPVASRNAEAKPWGVLLATLSLGNILQSSQAGDLAALGYHYHLETQPVSGRPSVLTRSTEATLIDPISVPIHVADGEWTLSIAPAQGWAGAGITQSQLALVFAAALVFSLTIFRTLREPDDLRAEVQKRSRRLSHTRRQLEEESAQRQVAEDMRQKDARHDKLTGLQSRGHFAEEIQTALNRFRRNEAPAFGLLFVDIDQFKRINETLGPPVGDAVLIELARRIECGVRVPADAVARVGSDQFALLLSDVADETAAADAFAPILKSVRVPYAAAAETTVVVSAGLVISSATHERAEDLLRDAATAMSFAPARARTGWALFDQQMRERALARQQLEIDLRRAIERQEFEVFYQPIVSLADGGLIGAEALVRWRHPSKGLIPPFEFIPFAEANGLIVAIDQLVVMAATKQTRLWQLQYPHRANLSISVNLSAQQISQPGLVEFIENALEVSGLPSTTLKLEVTESGVMESPEAAKETLLRLKALGAQILIDDFGTGYSSLGYLERFAFDIVKIDQTFVRNMDSNPKNREIIKAVVDLSQRLHMDVLAEGVETTAHLLDLRKMGCKYAQGYLFSKPLPKDDYAVMIAKGARAHGGAAAPPSRPPV